MGFLALLLPFAAFAYETDQLTDRHVPLDDATETLDAFTDTLLADAVAATNARTGCAADIERTRRILAHAIHERTATDVPVRDRGLLRSRGFDIYSAWIETNPELDKHRFLDRDDIFGDLTPVESVFLRFAGVCSTLSVAGVRVGTDKLDHFFEEGYDAWRRARYGDDPERGLAWATRTERTIYGLGTSKTFSFADLRADYDGFLFYDGLLEEGSAFGLDDRGCVVQERPWSWEEWVTWEYDEVLNPSVHTEPVQEGIARKLREERDDYCASYAKWGGDAYQQHLERVLAEVPPYVVGEAPERTDPYALDALCDADEPEGPYATDGDDGEADAMDDEPRTRRRGRIERRLR